MHAVENTRVPLPECIYLEVTNRCNLRCRTCVQYLGMKETQRDLSAEEAKLIADQLPALKRAVLHGIGEPLLNQELPQIIRYFKHRAVYVLFNSNVLLLSPQWVEDLIESKLDELRVSLDAATELTYGRVRGSKNFSLAVKNIEALLNLRQKRRSATPRVSAWMTGTRENVEDLPNLVKLASEIGIDEVYLQRLVYPLDGPGHGLADREQAITGPPEDILRILQTSMALSRCLNIRLTASGLAIPKESLHRNPGEESPWRRCRRPWEVAYITAWGNLLPCCISPFSIFNYDSLILGNVFEQSLEKIWTGEMYLEFRRKHQSSDPPESCLGCGVEWSL